ncbi:TNT domain-containing protein [Lentzea terrae]|uniref:TNT domain-containing protein n=1 Tax=Lentzea terrae TaxID=2200761 RepID=UPI0013002ADA|nr:TNT domain-containing protein [Lentzea terrae]
MGIELPVELTEVAAKAGVTWPKADEDAMRSSASAWREAGDKIKGLGTSSDGAATRALEGVTGATGDAARGRWAKVVAPDGDLQRAARGCHAAADRLDHAAQQVGAAKVEIVRELVTLAKNNDAAKASASTGNPNALVGLDTLTRGTAANVANLQNTLSAAIRLDSGVDMSHASPPVNTSPGAHGPGGLLSPVTNIVGGVVEPVAQAVAPVTNAVAPVVGGVTGPVAPVVGAVTGPVAPVVGAVTDAAAPVLNAAAPVTAPAAAVLQPAVEAVPGGRDTAGQVFDGPGKGHDEGPGRGEGHGEGRGPQVLPGLVPEVAQAVPAVVAPVADVIPSVQGSLGPIAEGTTQASAAVLDQPLIRGGEVPGQPAAPQAAGPAAPAAPAGPTLGGAPAGGPVGGPVGGAVGGAVGGVQSAAPAASAQVGAVAGQQGAAQQGQAQQGQAAQQGAKAADGKAGPQAAQQAAAAAKTGVPGAVGAVGQAVAGQAAGVQSAVSGQQGSGHAGQSGNQAPGQAQQTQAGGKDALAKDPAKDALKDALLKDPAFGDVGNDASGPGTQKVGETIAAPVAPGSGVDLGARSTGQTVTSAPLAGVDLSGGHQGGALTDRLDRLDNREHNQALSGLPASAYDIARHTYTAAAAGSWFMAIFLSAGRAPRLAPKPARQLPAPPAQEDQQVTPRFAPHDHPQADLVDVSAAQPTAHSEGLGKDHSTVQQLLEGYDPLAGMHERDWESLFQHEDGTPRWPVEREGGYEDSQPEVLEAGAELDRFGTPEGRVLATAGTPFSHRSLPPQAADEGYRRYRVDKDLPVHRTISAPWFGQPGGGSRYRTTYPVADLVALGYLTEITA